MQLSCPVLDRVHEDLTSIRMAVDHLPISAYVLRAVRERPCAMLPKRDASRLTRMPAPGLDHRLFCFYVISNNASSADALQQA